MAALEARVLGPFEVRRAGQPVAVGRSKQRDLLALLTAVAPSPLSTAAIVDELWHGAAPASARKVVQKHVSALRQLLGPAHVVSVGGGYALRDVGIDSKQFEAALEDARGADAHVARRRLRDALGLWAGEPYGDVELDALVPVRTRLSELHLAAFEQFNEARLSLGEHAALVGDLERLVADHPTREALWSLLMRALFASGRQAEALRAFQRVRAALSRELGIEPSGELRELERRILAQDEGDAATSPDVAMVEPDDVHRRVVTIVAVELGEPTDGDPEDQARSRRAVHEQLRAWCETAGGTFESTMGSRVVLAFGAPAHEDDADRAVHVANDIVGQLLSAKVSVATGWALVQESGDGRIIGGVVELACSGLAATAPGVAVIDPSTTEARARPIVDPPFIGREHELTIVGGALARTLSGRGPLAVTIRGEAGVGKTRLVEELRARSSTDTTWLQVRCTDGMSESEPLEAIVRDHVGLPESASPAAWGEAVQRLLASLVADDAERDWLGRRIAIAVGNESDSVERTETVAAWATYLTAVAEQGPVVIVLDDVQRTDPAFDALFADCCSQLRDVPLLVLSTARPDRPERAFQWVGSDSLTLTLRGLDAAETDELLAHLLADDRVTDAQLASLQVRSAGIPLYAIHFARMIRQRGWSGSIPDSTRSLIAARLDLLAPLERALVFAAAVADQPFVTDQLATMQGVDEHAAAVAVSRLIDKAIFVAHGRARMAFSHDLVREVADGQLVRARRARLHEAAAAWIEQHAGSRIAHDAMRVARHLATAASLYEEDGENTSALREHAFRMMIAAGDRLPGLEHLRTADALAHAVEVGAAAPDVAEFQCRRAAVLARRGQLVEAANAAARGLDAARQADDRALEARLRAMVGEIQWLRGETSACLSTLEAAMALVVDLPTDRSATEAVSTLAFVTALLGRPHEAIPLAERGLVLARTYGFAEKEVRCLNARGAARLLLGDLEGYSDFMQALTRALDAGLGHESAMAYHNLAELQLQGAGPASSAEMNLRGLELAERRGLTLAADWLRANRAQVLFEAGRWPESLAMADAVRANEARTGPGQAGTACGLVRARIHVWRGELDLARALIDEFLPRARQHAVIQQLGPALIVAAMVETASGHPAAGADIAQEYCELTCGTPAYRHMEAADLVRVLVAAARTDQAAAAADNDVIPAIRNQCHSITARAALARARGDADAATVADQAAELWRAYGHPLEEHLALEQAAWLRDGSSPGTRSAALAAQLGVSPRSVAALCMLAS